MSLILPGSVGFTRCTDNLTGTPSVTPGVNFTSGANDANGAAVTVLTALAHDVHYLMIGIAGVKISTGNSNALLDVLIDYAGGTSWSELIQNLACGFTGVTDATLGIEQIYHFPIYIPAGASLGVQCQTAHTSNITTGRCVMWAFGCPRRPSMWWAGSRVESLGLDTVTSAGVTVTAGNSGAFGSWATIGTSTKRYGAIQLGWNGSDTSALAVSYFWQLGVSSAQLAGTPNFHGSVATIEEASRSGFNMPIWCDIPSNTVLQCRGTCSGTAENHNFGIYGVY